LIEEILMLLTGIIAGTITGLIPGLHSNTIALITAALPYGNPISKIIFITAMGITHSIIETIPTIMLGASNENTIQLLPGHKMLMKGQGNKAIIISIAGALFTIIFTTLLTPFTFTFAKKFNWVLPIIIPAIIFAIATFMILKEKNKIIATIIFTTTALYGFFLLESGINEIIFALIIGFYGMPGLIETIITKTEIPKQRKKTKLKLNPSFSFLTAIISSITSMLPALGPAHAAFIATSLKGKLTTKEYLMLTGGISTGNLFYSILMLYTIGKTRSGVSIAIEKIMQPNLEEIILILAAAVSAAGFACAISIKLGLKIFELIKKINYKKITITVLFLCATIVMIFSGILGLIACISAAAIGLATMKAKISRAHCMGFLLAPSIIFYLK